MTELGNKAGAEAGRGSKGLRIIIPRQLTVALVGVACAAALVAGATAGMAAAPPPPAPAGTTGYDVSYPQCGSALPSGGGFGIAGVTNGLPWSSNPCLTQQYAWTTNHPYAPGVYMNTANPGPISTHWKLPGPATCVDFSSYTDPGCAYNYGWNAAYQAFGTASSATAGSSRSVWWWLDVELGNSWNGDAMSNAADLQGSVDFLRSQFVPGVGVYSTSYQWAAITGGYIIPASGGPPVADWLAGAGSLSEASSWCGPAFSFSGGPVQLVQYPAGSFDGDYVCQAAGGPPNVDFALSASPASQTVAQGATTSYTVTITSTGGFSGSVNLAVSGLPSGATGTLSPNPVTTSSSSATSTLSITASTTAVGKFPLTISGTSGTLSHTSGVMLDVTSGLSAPDFSLNASPSSRSIVAGASTSYGLSITESGGFKGSVTLSISRLPSGVRASFNPSQTSTSSTLTVRTAGTTRPGTYMLTITAKSGNLSHTSTVTLVISSSNH
jgi:hypothetical protein